MLVCAAGGNVALQAPAGHYDDRPGDAPGGRLDGIARRYRDNFASNLLSSVLLIEALAPRLTRPGGRLLLIGSIAAYRGSGEGSYGAMKAALHPLCYDLAARFGAQGVTVNLIAPGYIEATEFFADKLSDRKRAELIDQTLDQRPGTPDDIAAAVEWLAGQQASHITGQILQINGGAQLGC